jgi:hypothetical protein
LTRPTNSRRLIRPPSERKHSLAAASSATYRTFVIAGQPTISCGSRKPTVIVGVLLNDHIVNGKEADVGLPA